MKCFLTIYRKSFPSNFVLIMNLTTILILLFTVSASATGFSQSKINLQVKKSAIADAISKIEEQSSYRFLYNQNLGEINQKVSVKLQDASIDQALTELLKNSGLKYEFVNNDLIAIQKEELSLVDIVVKGKVTDVSGESLIGVTVKVKGSTSGVTTNIDGEFSISAPENATLVFSYLGYETVEQKLSGQSRLNIVLKAAVSQLNEVVVVGYGAVRKADLTGSVGTVSGETLTARGTTSVMSALQGAVAGVDINTNSVRPGGGFSIQIRGQNTMNSSGNSPLYVVDGVVMNDINFLNPSDIQKIDILKDASSTAIYGSRGSNGVVIVQTKNANLASSAKTTVSYDGYYGVRSLARLPDFMDGREWVDFRTSAFYTYNTTNKDYLITPANKDAILQKSPLLTSRLLNEDYVDWLGLGTQSGQQQNHFLNISGNSKDMSYNIGFGYQNEEGNFINENLDRYNLKLSIANKVSKRFTIGGNLSLSQMVNNQGSQFGYRDIMRMPVILGAYDANGSLIEQPGIAASIQGAGNFTSSPNPLNEINSGNQEGRRYDILGSIYGQVSILDDLVFKTTLMPRFNRNRVGRYYGVVAGNRNQDEAFQENSEAFDYTWDNQLTYAKKFGTDHTLNATLINSVYKTRFERIQAGTQALPYNSDWYNMFSGTLQSSNSNTAYNESSLLSYAARVNYDFRNKYLLTGTIRYDGSSKLADRWAAFPSVAFAWRASEEEFLKADFLSDLKARFSFGYSGNNNGIDPYGTQLTPQTGSLIWYDYNGSAVSGFAPGVPVNPNIAWERTRELNLGMDFGFFNQRLSGSVDLYNKLSDGLLMRRSLTIESGVEFMTDNIGSVSNKGLEVSLSTLNFNKKNFQWSTTLNFSTNKNAIESLYGKKEDKPGESRFIGQPINVIYDYRITGIWKQREADEAAKWGQQPGHAKAFDVNGDGLITASADRVILGGPDPSWTGGLNSNLTYKNWDFSFNVFTRQGVFVNDRFLEEFGVANTQRGRPKVEQDYYIPAGIARYDWNTWGVNANGSPAATWGVGTGNEDAKYPAINNAGPYYGGNGRYTDASFIKVRNIILGYALPKRLASKAGLSQLRVYANVLNPFTFTKYEGWDPEFATTTLQDGNGPSNITYQFGVNMKF
jgi:TonB-dependent starch-binding outer membrane protein SusC